jgi:NAD(P)-dependent dehydrogenase (short-subunit alcohol dehydrogenase family)
LERVRATRNPERQVAFVTGASRGIGAASAVALAARGFDVVVTARTLREGESADGRPLPGSVETTASAVRAAGGAALALHLDLLDRASIEAALLRVEEDWGRIDVLVNNGIYTGPGSMEAFLDLDLGRVRTMFEANVVAQIHVTQRVLPGMLERRSGAVINLVSGAGLSDPPAPAGEGGWGFAYGATKAAFHRMVGVLAVEHRERGVRFYNVEPGFVMTEAMKLNDPEGAISKRFRPAPPEVPAAVIAWLAADPAAHEHDGQTLYAQKLCLELGLHPDWR